MAELWLPGAKRFTASRTWTMDGGGARYANWHSTENDPSASASDLARYLVGIRAEPHLVWNPWTGEICQLLPANRGGSVLKAGNHKGSVNIGIECIGRAGVVGKRPLIDSPMKGFDQILAWLRSWGIPDVWPAGAPLPYPQSAGYGNPQRGRWGASGHYGHSQWPQNDHGDPGVTRTELWTGVVTPVEEEDELKVPTIRYGFDVGHPGITELISSAIDVINPAEQIRSKDADRKQTVIKFFQAVNGLDDDGLVGPKTFGKIMEQAANK